MRGTDLLFAASLATLVFYGAYAAVIVLGDPRAAYHLIVPLGPAVYGALLVATALVAAAIALMVLTMRRNANRTVQFAGGAVLAALLAVAAVGILRVSGANSLLLLRLMREAPWLFRPAGLAVLLLLGLAAAAAAWHWRRHVAPAVYWIVFCFFPVALWNTFVLAREAWITRHPPAWVRNAPLAPATARSASGPHIVVLVFDGADYRLLFENPSLRLPELARLRSESLFATRALPPSGHTRISLPALQTGRYLRDSAVAGPSDVTLTFDDGASARWSATPTIFTRAKQDGLSSALIGWYHPYCRILGDQLADCTSYEVPTQGNAVSRSFAPALRDFFRLPFETPSFSPFGQSLVIEKSVENYRGILDGTMRVLGRHNIVFSHFSIPHPPYIAGSRFGGYAGNLVLMDATVGAIRKRLEELGTWNRTAIVVTSDHWHRALTAYDASPDRRVPFLVKLPGQREGVEYARPFNTFVTGSLVQAMLRGEVRAAAELAPWLDAHATDRLPATTEEVR